MCCEWNWGSAFKSYCQVNLTLSSWIIIDLNAKFKFCLSVPNKYMNKWMNKKEKVAKTKDEDYGKVFPRPF